MYNKPSNPRAKWISPVKEIFEKLEKGEPLGLSKIPNTEYMRAGNEAQKLLLRRKLKDVLVLAEVPLNRRIHCFNHDDRNPSLEFREDKQALQCVSCNSYGKTWDIFDLIGIFFDIDWFPNRLEKAKELFLGDETSLQYPYPASTEPKKQPKMDAPKAYNKTADATKGRIYKDVGGDQECLDFIKLRGITSESIKKFRLKCWEHSTTGDRYLVIPCEQRFCVRRRYKDVSMNPEWKFRNPYNPDKDPALKVSLFNKNCLHSYAEGEWLFVVESAICAILMSQMGYKAVALNGGGNHDLILNEEELIRRKRIRLALLLDNDPSNAGIRNAIDIHKAFEKMGIPTYLHWNDKLGVAAFLANYKDIGDAYVADCEQTTRSLEELVKWLNTSQENIDLTLQQFEKLKKNSSEPYSNPLEFFGRAASSRMDGLK